MNRLVKADLAARGITSKDLVADQTGRTMNMDKAAGVIFGWTWTVALRSGEVLVYTMDNADDAPVMCGDEELQLADPTSASEE